MQGQWPTKISVIGTTSDTVMQVRLLMFTKLPCHIIQFMLCFLCWVNSNVGLERQLSTITRHVTFVVIYSTIYNITFATTQTDAWNETQSLINHSVPNQIITFVLISYHISWIIYCRNVWDNIIKYTLIYSYRIIYSTQIKSSLRWYNQLNLLHLFQFTILLFDMKRLFQMLVGKSI